MGKQKNTKSINKVAMTQYEYKIGEAEQNNMNCFCHRRWCYKK